jgi:5-methyltetrahydropteroyltriglutamate--homocysteine methyltransferase
VGSAGLVVLDVLGEHALEVPLPHDQYLGLHVAALNEAVAGLPPDRTRMHICWGNYEGPHHMDVDLTEVLPAVFEARPAAILFEAANPRHEHEWEDLGKLKIPDDKVLIPGSARPTAAGGGLR